MQDAGLDMLSMIFQQFTAHKTACMSIAPKVDDRATENDI